MTDPDSKLEPGTTLDGRYELAEEIARGGFGMVYRARQLNMDREVAIKMVPPEFMDLPDVVQRFEREARLASRLNHPNTITVHDYGQHEDFLFLVMELLEGEDLADVLARQRDVELDRIARISRQVLKSLNEAHQHGIIHRDLKPENIFLTEISGESDFVKVVDFGIAKLAMPEMQNARDTDQRLTVEGNTVGTPTYMSPEQAAGGDVDARSDLYALGVMMHEMAAGEPPFDTEDPAKLMRQHIFKEIPELPTEDLQESWLQPVVRRAMAKEKEDRYQDAASFIDAIDYALQASNDERAFAPTQEQEAVELEPERIDADGTDEDLEEDSVEFVNQPASDDHAAHDPDSATHSTPSDAPNVGAASENSAIQAPSTDQNTQSSIMTVLEPSPDEDVIVLDEPKDKTPADNPSRRSEPVGGEPREETGTSTGGSPQSQRASIDPQAAEGGRFSPGSSSERKGSSGDSDPEKPWSWSGEYEAQNFDLEADARTDVDLRRSWTPVLVGLVIVAAVAAALLVYLQGLPL